MPKRTLLPTQQHPVQWKTVVPEVPAPARQQDRKSAVDGVTGVQTCALPICQDCGGPLTNAEAHSTADSTTPSSVENCCAGSASASPPAQQIGRLRQFRSE